MAQASASRRAVSSGSSSARHRTQNEIHDGLGVLEGADAYVEAASALWDLAPDIQTRGRVLALEQHGQVRVEQNVGTLRDGGGAFERQHVDLYIVDNGRIIPVGIPTHRTLY